MGFPFPSNAFACASDRVRRADIIRLAAERAGASLENSVYVGDGPWDLRATQELEIPFIGVGRRLDELRQLGAQYVLEEFSMPGLLRVLDVMEKAPSSQ